jgi:hypothetical protein
MKRMLTILMTIAVTAVLSVVSPLNAAAVAPLGWRCTIGGSYSDSVSPFATHWRVGADSATRYVFWLHEGPVEGLYRYTSTDYVSCNPLLSSRPVTSMPTAWLSGQPACTTGRDPGVYTDVVNGTIARHRLIGEQRSTTGLFFPTTTNFRIWVDERQLQPGQWTWYGNTLAGC